jgi:proteasome accessory factor A
MAEMLFGVETEYAVAGSNVAGAIGQEDVLRGLMNQAQKELVNLPGLSASGVFLGNGARFYADCGNHPELCTPECSNPWDLVRYIQAGHRILARLAAGLKNESTPGTEIMCFRGNVDYSGSCSTWGCHESYMHRMVQEELQPQIVPHLVTRPIYTGAGGFNPTVRGLEFTLSPRLAYFNLVETESSTGGRGIWHNKSESLCEGYGRLHVLCGESLCSETATFLKVGVTALIVAMADAGLEPGKAVQLADPLEALRTVANDVTCKKPLKMKDGSRRTAIEVQREYLKVAEANLGAAIMPEWAGEVCRKWREILDRLEGGALAVEKTLDWAIKLALYERHARGWGIKWAELGFWSEFIGRCYEALGARRGRGGGVSLGQAIEPGQRVAKELVVLAPMLEARGLDWDDLRALLRSREEFFAIDTRFGQIGAKGIFESLATAGVLEHHVQGVDRIEEAMAEPPAVGRARIRGEVIKRLAGSAKAQADWANVVNFHDGQALDLSDPFAREEVWEPLDQYEIRERQMSLRFDGFFETGRSWGESGGRNQYSRRQEAFDCYQSGDYAGAEVLLRPLVEEGFEVASNRCHLARSLMLMDREGEARAEIEGALHSLGGASDYVLPRVLFFKWMFAILDGGRTAAIARRMKAALRNPCASSSWTIQPMIDYMRARLGDENFNFLTALAAALSGERNLERLEEFVQWRGRAVERSAA